MSGFIYCFVSFSISLLIHFFLLIPIRSPFPGICVLLIYDGDDGVSNMLIFCGNDPDHQPLQPPRRRRISCFFDYPCVSTCESDGVRGGDGDKRIFCRL